MANTFGARIDATPDQSAPVAVGERLSSLDFIRGIAVLGILFANIIVFGNPSLANSWPGGMVVPMGDADNGAWLAQFLIIDGKMRGLFSVLFGAGMILFLERAWQRGQGRMLQFRRLVILMLFGLAHFFLLFWGDILYLYALTGMLALTMVNWSARRQFRMGLSWYLAASLLVTLGMAAQAVPEQMPETVAGQEEALARMDEAWTQQEEGAAKELALMQEGDYLAEVHYTATDHLGLLITYPVIGLLETLPLMLIGMSLYRDGFFSGGWSRERLAKWAWGNLALGVALTLPLALWTLNLGFPPFLHMAIANGASSFGRLPMILGLAALFVLITPKAAPGWLGQRLVAAGRMAFSNYVGTSVLMMLIFRHWSLGQFGQLSRVELMLVAVFGSLVMLAWSKPWLDHFRYGPLEWLWRCLTYGKPFPIRR